MKNPILPDRESSKNWTEDSSLENGNYVNKCISCKHWFLGHKNRVICKECDNPIPSGSWYRMKDDGSFEKS